MGNESSLIFEAFVAEITPNALYTRRHQRCKTVKTANKGRMIQGSMFGSPLIITELDKGAITSLRFSPTGDRIAVGSSLGCLLLFETGANTPTVDFPPVDGPLNQLCWDPKSSNVYSVTESGSIWVHNTDILTMNCIYNDPSFAFLSCAVSPDGTRVICGATNGQLLVIYPHRSNTNELIRGHTAAVISVSFDPEGEFFLTCSHDTLARLWSADTLQCLETFTYNSSPMCDCTFRTDGKMMLIANSLNTVYCLDRESHAVRKILTVNCEPGTYIVYTGFLRAEAETCVTVGTSDGCIHIFNDGTFPGYSFTAQDAVFAAVDVHPFLPMLVTGGGPDDMTFKLWHKDVVRTAQEVSVAEDEDVDDYVPVSSASFAAPIELG